MSQHGAVHRRGRARSTRPTCRRRSSRYYTYGAAIALALDLSLRDRSNGKVSLDDYMRAMWRVARQARRPEPGPGRQAVHAEGRARPAGRGVGRSRVRRRLLHKYVEGREVPDYARLLARAGIVFRKRNAGAAVGRSRGGRRRTRTGAGSPAGGVRDPAVASDAGARPGMT